MSESTIPEPVQEPLDVVTPAGTPIEVVTGTDPLVVVGVDPENYLAKTARYTATQTSTILVDPGASKLVVGRLHIGVGGTTAGELVVYFGTGAYVRGTNFALFDHEFVPSSTSKPGALVQGDPPMAAGAAGDDLRVTTTAAMTVTITAWYYTTT